VTLTGRVRAGVNYTQAKNTRFQGLAADGAKLALWRLLYAGFDVCGFVHDEILVELPADGAAERAMEVERIMVRAMEDVMGHGVPAAVKSVVGGDWAKP
jgi:DNA polymerase I-like protein with 3'-5' exonuclease and polymerase domains